MNVKKTKSSKKIVLKITMYPVMGSQCAQWAHVEFFHNVPINVITMSPVAYVMVSFTMFFTMCPPCP